MSKTFLQLQDAVDILKLNKDKMLQVSKKKYATIWAVIFLLVPPLVNLILMSFSFPSGFGVIFSRFLLWPIFIPALSLAGVLFLASLIAQRSFGGKGKHVGFFRTVGYSSIILWITIIPFILSAFGLMDALGLFNFISIIAIIWIFAVIYKMLIIYHLLSQYDAVFVLVITFLGYFVLKSILGRILVGRVYRLLF
ncbi:hypothetical protein GF366_01855 [Candidatus Peregrinibacteria bacterium]|nr:hypothetical protein [Candidatus Peregrinibacteria bacterium]